MKKVLKGVCIAAAAAALAIGLFYCSGGGDPKTLATQSANLIRQGMQSAGDTAKADEIVKKITAIEIKANKLSEANQKIYREELSRILNQGL